MTPTTRFVRLTMTLSLAMIALVSVPSYAQEAASFSALVSAVRSDAALARFGDVLADKQGAAELTAFLTSARAQGAKLTQKQIVDAATLPSAAQAALDTALAFARGNKALQQEALSMVGSKLQFNELVATLRQQELAAASTHSLAAKVSTTSPASHNPFAPTDTAATPGKWSISGQAVPTNVASALDAEMARLTAKVHAEAIGVEPAALQAFDAAAAKSPKIVAEITGRGNCHLDQEAETNWLYSIAEGAQGMEAGYSGAAAVNTSLMNHLNVTAEEADKIRQHEATVCDRYAGAAAAAL